MQNELPADRTSSLDLSEPCADQEVDAASAALDLVDGVLAALDQEDLERAEELLSNYKAQTQRQSVESQPLV